VASTNGAEREKDSCRLSQELDVPSRVAPFPVPTSRTIGNRGVGHAPPASARPPLKPLPPAFLGSMAGLCVALRRKFLPPRLHSPVLANNIPKGSTGSAWVHEIKHDGYRLIARKDGRRVRLYTRRGYDWSGKYPWIVEALRSLRVHSIIVDGEAVWAGKDGKSDFNWLIN
jgi:hypothetical protein